MPTVRTSLVMPHSPDAIWRVLSDWPAYGEWCRLMPRITGEARVGGRVDLKLRLVGPPMSVDAIITRYEPGRGLSWEGPSNPVIAALGKGHHGFEIVDLGDGHSRFVHSERFTGPTLRLAWPWLGPRAERAYAEFNEELSRRVQAVGAS